MFSVAASVNLENMTCPKKFRADRSFAVRYSIWYHLCNLKNVKNTHGGVLILVKLQASASNFTKINTPPWLFFWFQITEWLLSFHESVFEFFPDECLGCVKIAFILGQVKKRKTPDHHVSC